MKPVRAMMLPPVEIQGHRDLFGTVASISNAGATQGLATGLGNGTTVTSASLSSIEVTSDTSSAVLGDTVEFTAQISVTGEPNLPPHAILVCPGGGQVGQTLDWDMAYCAILYNGEEGLRYLGGSDGSVARTNIKYNGLSGVYLQSTSGNSPQPSIGNSNIYGNSVTNSLHGVIEDTSATLTVTGVSSSGNHDSPTWSLPGPGQILRVHVDFYDYYYATGYLLRPDDTEITHYTSTTDTWRWIADPAVAGIKVRLYNSSSTGSSAYNRMSVTEIEYRPEGNQTIELTTNTASGQVDATQNYWGQSSDVFQRISMSRPDAVDFTGWKLSEVDGCGPR